VAAGLAEPDRLVTIVEPKATWPTEFEAISTSIRNALGPLALRIDQIGSTPVPDLPAKDVIDVQVPLPRCLVNMRIFTEVRLHLLFNCPASAGPVSF
jgi:GrpB-like predicted nucleotidyltransferase (UPF0157 family)